MGNCWTNSSESEAIKEVKLSQESEIHAVVANSPKIESRRNYSLSKNSSMFKAPDKPVEAD